MKKINVAIVGYGNLGKALETLLLKDDRYNLCQIFSRRNIKAKVPVSSLDKIQDFKQDIDFLFLCSGSKSDLENQSLILSNDFNTIDSFDNHNHIPVYIKNLNKRCILNNHTSICCCGWDPGLFSLMRLLFSSIQNNAYTFWGKGVSQGHSQAIRNIKDVQDAIQYTLPNRSVIKKIKKGTPVAFGIKDMHKRLCYVVSDQNKKTIKNNIIDMPDYFEGYKTKVKFISETKIKKHKTLSHAGQVLTLGNIMNFSLNLPSNPNFTAQVMIAYGIALYNMIIEQTYGAFSILDIAPKYLSIKDYSKHL